MNGIKNKIVCFISEYETFLAPVARFLIAVGVFFLIREEMGYSTLAGKIPVLLVMALVCALLPLKVMIWFAAALITVNLYALSMSCALVFILLFMVIFLIYFRFTPKDSLAVILTPVAFHFQIPYVMPVSVGLLSGPYSVLSVICGTVVYYLLSGIKTHASEIAEMEADAETGLTSKINLALGQVVGNKDMYLVLAVFTVTAVLVYLLRRTKLDHAWTLAIIAGILVQMLGLFVGYMVLQVSGKTLWLLLGHLISMVICFLIEYIYMDLDYSRVERVQFEDDDYYYYVKAVPKNMDLHVQKKEIHFGSQTDADNSENNSTES